MGTSRTLVCIVVSWAMPYSDRKEIPVGVAYNENRALGSLAADVGLYDHHVIPDNEYEALMRTLPLQEPTPHFDEVDPGWGSVEPKFLQAGLSERDKLVIECVVGGQMTYRETGEFLAREHGRSKAYLRQTVHRWYNDAINKLRKAYDDELG
jgi:hypothetical protein